MALVIEDGTGKEDAQSYATAANLVDYAAQRGITIPVDEAEQERLLIKAMDYMETLSYRGDRASYAQALQWPRKNVTLYGYDVGDDEIPASLVKAQCQLAVDSYAADLMPTTVPSDTGAVIEETVEGAVSVKYAAPSANADTAPVPAHASALLGPLLLSQWQLKARRG